MKFKPYEINDGHYSRGAVRIEDGIVEFRASSFGSCKLAMWLAAHGVDPLPMPEKIQQAAAHGTLFESAILAEAEQKGFEISPTVAFVTENDGWKLTVTPDAKVSLGGIDHPVECKLLANPSNPLSNPRYAWQFSIECAAFGVPKGLYVTAKRVREGFEDVRAEILPAPYTPEEIRARAEELVEIVRGEKPECDFRMYPCGFYNEHSTQPIWTNEVAQVDDPDLDRYAREYLDITEQINKLQKQKDWLRQEIMDRLTPGESRTREMKFSYVIAHHPAQKIERKEYTQHILKVKKL